MAVSGERVRRFCFQHQIYNANEGTRTHFHSHPKIKNMAIAPSLLDGFCSAVAEDMEAGVVQRIGEWLTPRFTFFVEVHMKALPDESIRRELARFFAREVGHYAVTPTAVLVLGWDGTHSGRCMRMRYIFEGIIVDRRRAYHMHNYLRHRAFADLAGAARHALVDTPEERYRMETDWFAALPSDVYAKATNGERTMMMVGSYGMQKCIGPGTHAHCPHCLGDRVVVSGGTMPLSLLHVLDEDGREREDASKIVAVDAVRRTMLRSTLPLSEAWAEPIDAPATPFDADTGTMRGSMNKAEEAGRKPTKTQVEMPFDTDRWRVLTHIIRRHMANGVYADLKIDKVFKSARGGGIEYVVHPSGRNDRRCGNINGTHEHSRIAFVVNSVGARQICFYREPCGTATSGGAPLMKTPCKNYMQRADLHPLTLEEKTILGFATPSVYGGSGSTAHQMQHTKLPEMKARLINPEPPKKRRRR